MLQSERAFYKEIKRYKKYIVYGAGNAGNLVLKYLEEKRMTNRIVSFAISGQPKDQVFNGHDLRCIDDFSECSKDVLVILAVTERYHAEMKENAMKYGFEHFVSVSPQLFSFLNLKYIVNVGNNIFFCEGYYHLLISMIYTVVYGLKSDVVLTNGLEKNKKLMSRLVVSGVFRNVLGFSKGSVNEYIGDNLLEQRIVGNRKNVQFFEKEFIVDLSRYEKVFLFFDDNKIGRYIQSKRIRYILMEDCFNFMNEILEVKFSKEVEKWGTLKYKICNLLGIGYFPFGQSRYCIGINVNSELKHNLYRGKKVFIDSREELFNRLDRKQKDLLTFVFVENSEKMREVSPSGKSLIITQPLFIDGFVGSLETQVNIYKKVIADYCKNSIVYFKPHPRDMTDYSQFFNDAIILEKNVPTEVWNFQNKILFEQAITVNSAAIEKMDFVEKKIKLGLDYLNRF